MAFVQYRSYLLVRDGDKLELFEEGGLEIYDHYRQDKNEHNAHPTISITRSLTWRNWKKCIVAKPIALLLWCTPEQALGVRKSIQVG